MSARIYPREGSRAYIALTSIHLAGGRSDLSSLLTACDWNYSNREFERTVLEQLQFQQMIAVDGDTYAITSRGMERIGAHGDAVQIPSDPAPAGPRVFTAGRDLSRQHMIRMPLTREGAHDYASIPSRMGDQSVPHLATGTLIGGDER